MAFEDASVRVPLATAAPEPVDDLRCRKDSGEGGTLQTASFRVSAKEVRDAQVLDFPRCSYYQERDNFGRRRFCAANTRILSGLSLLDVLAKRHRLDRERAFQEILDELMALYGVELERHGRDVAT
jgi:hypothetical protein